MGTAIRLGHRVICAQVERVIGGDLRAEYRIVSQTLVELPLVPPKPVRRAVGFGPHGRPRLIAALIASMSHF